MSRILDVYIYGTPVGVLSENPLGHLEFQYNASAFPLSVRMPVRSEKYEDTYAEPFFDNLLPEGDALDLISQKFHISKGNVFSVLDQIGGDCAGAISLYPAGQQVHVDTSLKEIDKSSLTQIIDELPINPLLTGLENAPRLSLAGAQSKFAVYKADDGKYYRSNDEHPTTHIIKITNKYFDGLLENELFCMNLAKKIFHDAIDVQINMVDGRKYLEIQRYDRRLVAGKIERIHQEDFCQVLGYLSRRKYQSDGGPKIRQIYEAIMKYSNRKALDGYKFIQLLIFNYLIGNTDAHAKNFSFLHVDKNNTVILSPAYDLVSVDIYPKKIVSHEIAMTINGKGTYDSLNKKDWEALFTQLHLNATSMMKEMKKIFSKIVNDAHELEENLNKNALTSSDVYEKIITNIDRRYKILFE